MDAQTETFRRLLDSARSQFVMGMYKNARLSVPQAIEFAERQAEQVRQDIEALPRGVKQDDVRLELREQWREWIRRMQFAGRCYKVAERHEKQNA